MTTGSGTHWPKTPEELRDLAGQLLELVGGRRNAAPRYYNFTPRDKDEPIKGWAPWRGKAIAKDYPLQEGELDTLKDDKRFLLRPLNTETVSLHLRGKERLGVYAIDDQENVSFLAADFDDHDGTLEPEGVWNEVKNFWQMCENNEFPAHIERSKSGTGYHVWVFFDAPVSAAKARAIGRYLMEDAGAIRQDEDFSTFDRFFPSQSYLTGKGFGNLIALPMCGEQNYQKGFNAWVNPESGDTIKDGPEYLLEILNRGRVPASEVDVVLEEFAITDTIEQRGEVAEHQERDSDEKLGSETEYETMVSRCQFMQWATDPDHQNDVSEPLWFAMLSNGARFDVDVKLHEGSEHHSGYSHDECQNKINYVRRSSPVGCLTIQREGFSQCPGNGCQRPCGNTVKSPAGLSAWTAKGKRPPLPPIEAYDDEPQGPKKANKKNKKETDLIATDQPESVSAPAPDLEDDEEQQEQLWKDDVPVYDCSGLPWPYVEGGWDVSTEGLRLPSRPIKDNKGKVIGMSEGDLITHRPIWVHAITMDTFASWGAVIHFFDYDWRLGKAYIPLKMLSESGGKFGMAIREQGMPMIAGKEKWVCRYLDDSANMCRRRAMTANKLGWFDAKKKPVFVMPMAVIGGEENNTVVYQTNHMQDTSCISSDGTLKDWQERVAKPCRGNPLLMFAAMCAFAGPFLKLCRGESAGFHFYGATSGGKTTLLQVAASVWGDGTDPQEGADHTSIRKWHSTGNALEATAQMHNDMTLCLDEVGQVEPGDLGNIIYMLSGGQPKGRSQVEGGLKKQVTWRLLFLSNGEMTVGQILAQAGQAEKGGQRHRLPDIPCDNPNGDGSGVVIDSHDQDVKRFVDDIKEACGEHYGHAGPVLVAWLVGQIEDKGFHQYTGFLREQVKSLESYFRMNGKNPIDLPNDGGRVIRRMAIVALAGIMASQAGIVPWKEEDIYKSVFHIRNLWLKELGEEMSEEDRALAFFRAQLLENMAQFRNIDHAGDIKDAIGLKGKGHIMPFTHAMKKLAGNFDQNMILKALLRDGLLWPESGRLARKSPKIKDQTFRPRVYAIKDKFLGDPGSAADQDDWENVTYDGVIQQ